MKVLFIDFETNSPDAKTAHFTEVGLSLYDYHNKTWTKDMGTSCFAYEPEYPPQPEKIVELTGITDEMLKQYGSPRKDVIEMVKNTYMSRADIIVAHKIAFDKTVLFSSAKLFDIELPEKEWLCTLTNFPWPEKYTCHKLGHLGWEHDLDVKASTLHRAQDDVDLLQKLVAKYDFEKVLEYAREEWVYLKAPEMIGPWVDGGKQTGIAKSLGFSWEQVKGVEQHKWDKTWVTRVKASRLEALAEKVRTSESPFRLVKIEGLK